MAEKLCELKKKGGGGGASTLEPNTSELLQASTTGYLYSQDCTSLLSSGNSVTGTNLKCVYNSPSAGYFTVTALTAGKYRVIGFLQGEGIHTEIIDAQANQVICRSRYSGYQPAAGYYSLIMVYKIS